MPALHLLTPAIREYAWGSTRLLAELQGRPSPTATPEAEAWFGAHPASPARLDDGTGLDALIGSDPAAALGVEVLDRFGPRLPFLVKLLCAGAPLSLQCHPSAAQAAAGYDAEEAAGVPFDAPHRRYRDRWPKPELLYALTPFAALCGFRGPPRTARFLEAMDVPALDRLRRDLADRDQAALAPAVRWILRDGREEAAGALDQLRAGAARLAARAGEDPTTLPAAAASAVPVAGADAPDDAWWPIAARWLVELIDRYPGDPGSVVALLLRVVELAPGEAIHLPAGNLHAYLDGAGVEVQASSDNVLRGGLTPKHVDVDALLDVVDARFLPTPWVPGRRDVAGSATGEVVHATASPHFRLSHLALTPRPVDLPDRGPQILLAVGGDATVTVDGATATIPRGGGAFVAASAQRVTVAGSGQLFRATVGGNSTVDERRGAR